MPGEIIISKVLEKTQAECLKNYFNIDKKVSVYDLFKRIFCEFDALELEKRPSLTALSAFALVDYSWKAYGGEKYKSKLNRDEIYWMFCALKHSISHGKTEGIKGLSAEAVFNLVKEAWNAKLCEPLKNRIANGGTTRVAGEIDATFPLLSCVFFALGRYNKEGMKGLNAKEVFDLVKKVCDDRKDLEDDCKLTSNEVMIVFEALLPAIQFNNDEGLKELNAKAVFDLVKEACDIRKNRKDDKSDFGVCSYSFKVPFWTLSQAIEKCDKTELKAKAVFDLVKEFWHTREEDVRQKLEPNKYCLERLFEALSKSIEKCNSEGLSTSEVFDLIKEVFQQAEPFKDTVRLMLGMLCLISKIDKQSEKEMKLKLASVGLNIADGNVVLVNENKLSGFANQYCAKLILEIVPKQENKEENIGAQEEKPEQNQESISDEVVNLLIQAVDSNNQISATVKDAILAKKIELDEDTTSKNHFWSGIFNRVLASWSSSAQTLQKIVDGNGDITFNVFLINDEEFSLAMKVFQEIYRKNDTEVAFDGLLKAIKILRVCVTQNNNYAKKFKDFAERKKTTAIDTSLKTSCLLNFISEDDSNVNLDETKDGRDRIKSFVSYFEFSEEDIEYIVHGKEKKMEDDLLFDLYDSNRLNNYPYTLNNIEYENTTINQENVEIDDNDDEEKKVEETTKECVVEEGGTLDISRFNDFDSFYNAVKKGNSNINDVLNSNKKLENFPITYWGIIKTFFWRLFCCGENPFDNLCSYTKLREYFNQLNKKAMSSSSNLNNVELEVKKFSEPSNNSLLTREQKIPTSKNREYSNSLRNK